MALAGVAAVCRRVRHVRAIAPRRRLCALRDRPYVRVLFVRAEPGEGGCGGVHPVEANCGNADTRGCKTATGTDSREARRHFRREAPGRARMEAGAGSGGGGGGAEEAES